ncbi:hypothetical protein SLEP1_g5557 [Rubroshorea leprosula]|uniref:Maturase K n=1 Tax=Rubroshorea leprosula TaxID=152421 RepID=A0AAV5HY92_9ROSI|nr:hypothetical protein SLEP1_g5557 [Rubroshorea leprosula]
MSLLGNMNFVANIHSRPPSIDGLREWRMRSHAYSMYHDIFHAILILQSLQKDTSKGFHVFSLFIIEESWKSVFCKTPNYSEIFLTALHLTSWKSPTRLLSIHSPSYRTLLIMSDGPFT